MLQKIRTFVEWAFALYAKYRPPLLPRSAALVVISGILLIGIHFNTYLSQIFLEPLGFNFGDPNAPVFAVLLIVIGLTFLVLDRLAPKLLLPPALGDKELMNAINDTANWPYHDHILDRIFNCGYSPEDIEPLWRVRSLLARPESFFVDEETNKALDVYKGALNELAQSVVTYFSPQIGQREIYYVMLERLDPDRTGVHDARFASAHREIKEKISAFDEAVKSLFRTARQRGLMPAPAA